MAIALALADYLKSTFGSVLATMRRTVTLDEVNETLRAAREAGLPLREHAPQWQ